MSDLVKRLRTIPRTFNDAVKDMHDAADRIEALETALRQIMNGTTTNGYYEAARAALAPACLAEAQRRQEQDK